MERLTRKIGEKWVATYGAQTVIDRLSAYEDTGFAPEDIKGVFNETAVLKLAAQILRTTPDRLREIYEAECDRKIERRHETQRWIPVEERLPECRRSVLVYCPIYNNIYCAAIQEDGTWRYFMHGDYRVYENVTHWMPLPNPPKEEEK